MPEMSAYTRMSVNPIYTALLRAEAKGYVRRNPENHNRFEIVAPETES